MRHRKAYKKLGRLSEHRMLLLANLATDLLKYEKLTTTVAKCKALRPIVERLITKAKNASGNSFNAQREVAKVIRNREVVHKLFNELAPRYKERPGGYTRIVRIGWRVGDAGPVARIELVK